jgi:hypothetical protein
MLQDGEAYVFGMADVLVDQPALVLHAKDSEAVPFAPADYRHLLDVGDALPIIQDGVCCHWLPPIARVPGPDGMSVMDRQNYVGKITRDCDGAARPVSPPPRLALDNVQDVLLLPPGYPAPRDSSFLRALLRNEVHIDNWPDHPDEDESWQAEDPHRDIDTSYLLLPRSWHDIARERLFVHSAAPIGKVDLDELHDVARKLGNDPTPVHVGQLCCHTFAAAVLLNSTKDEWKREHSRPVIEELRRIMDECKGVQA